MGLSIKVSIILMLLVCGGCDLEYPEVAVVNNTAEYILIKNPSFNGCVWNTVLAYGAATSPGRCLPGDDHVHFQKFDAQEYCQDQAKDGTLPGVCPCDGGVAISPDGGVDQGLVNAVPLSVQLRDRLDQACQLWTISSLRDFAR